jgi:3-deoxy-D-manno-octulosonic-acid transferase
MMGNALATTDTALDLTNGTLTETRNPLDLAVEGDGFFVTSTPAGERLVRGGSFHLDASHTVFLAGSTQDPEEQYALDIFKQLAPAHPGLRLILVPRHPQRFDEVAALLDASGAQWMRRSHLYAHSGQQWRILLVDTIGELGAWWGTAAVGFVGGSFGSRGGQNMLEPAAYGVATCFGPNTWNFRDIVAALTTANGGSTQTQAVYLQDAWQLIERWRLTVGARYEQWRAFGGSRSTSTPLRALL